MNKRIKLIIVIFFILGCIGCIVFFTTNHSKKGELTKSTIVKANKKIDSEKYNIKFDNIYYLYQENQPEISESTDTEKIKVLSDYLKSNYPGINVLLKGFTRIKSKTPSMDEIIENEQYMNYIGDTSNQEAKYDYLIEVDQIQNGIILINKSYSIVVDSSNNVVINGVNENPFMQDVIDQSSVVDLSDINKKVLEEINNNKEALYIEDVTDIEGKERLEYDGTRLYYYYTLNDSYLKIDAYSGEVIEESLMNNEYSIQ